MRTRSQGPLTSSHKELEVEPKKRTVKAAPKATSKPNSSEQEHHEPQQAPVFLSLPPPGSPALVRGLKSYPTLEAVMGSPFEPTPEVSTTLACGPSRWSQSPDKSTAIERMRQAKLSLQKDAVKGHQMRTRAAAKVKDEAKDFKRHLKESDKLLTPRQSPTRTMYNDDLKKNPLFPINFERRINRPKVSFPLTPGPSLVPIKSELLTVASSARKRGRDSSDDDEILEPSPKRKQYVTGQTQYGRYDSIKDYDKLKKHIPKHGPAAPLPSHEDFAIAAARLAEEEDEALQAANKAAEQRARQEQEGYQAELQRIQKEEATKAQITNAGVVSSIRAFGGSVLRTFTRPFFGGAPATEPIKKISDEDFLSQAPEVTREEALRRGDERMMQTAIEASKQLGRPLKPLGSIARVQQRSIRSLRRGPIAEDLFKRPNKSEVAQQPQITSERHPTQSKAQATTARSETQTSDDEDALVDTPTKKRKRPSATGAEGNIASKRFSYGMLDDEPAEDIEEDTESQTEDEVQVTPIANKQQKLFAAQTPRSALKKRNADGIEQNTLKKSVNFGVNQTRTFFKDDRSPASTPSSLKTSPRATDRYTGTIAADHTNAFESDDSSVSFTFDKTLMHPHQTNRNTFRNSQAHSDIDSMHSTALTIQRNARDGTVVQPSPGKFCLDYDAYEMNDELEDDIDTMAIYKIDETTLPEAESTPRAPAPTSPRPSHAQLPKATNSALTLNDNEALNRARSSAEKYKPKTSTPLRESRVRSSSPMSDKENMYPSWYDADVAAEINRNWGPEDDAKMESYNFKWPQPKTYAELGIAPQYICDMVSERWTQEDDEAANRAFEYNIKQFRDAKAAGFTPVTVFD